MISNAEFRKDFIEYSGGYTPDEAFDEMTLYVEAGAYHASLNEELVDAWFEEWLDELEGT